jgi:glycerophosphoryl diester phosphodiesterase
MAGFVARKMSGVSRKLSGSSRKSYDSDVSVNFEAVAQTTELMSSVVAHRGFHSKYLEKERPLENTLEAFETAWRSGVHLCECDVQLTKDGVLVVNHDPNLARLANDPDVEIYRAQIHNLTWAELQALELRDGTRVPTLEQTLESAIRCGRFARLVIEIKSDHDSLETTDRLFELLHKRADLRARVAVVMSFDTRAIRKFATLKHDERFDPVDESEAPHPKIMLLTIRANDDPLEHHVQLDYEMFIEDPDLVDRHLKVPTPVGHAYLDGFYVRFQREMVDDDIGEEMFRLACMKCSIGVWMYQDDPDNLETAYRLVEAGAMFVNSDFEPNLGL